MAVVETSPPTPRPHATKQMTNPDQNQNKHGMKKTGSTLPQAPPFARSCTFRVAHASQAATHKRQESRRSSCRPRVFPASPSVVHPPPYPREHRDNGTDGGRTLSVHLVKCIEGPLLARLPLTKRPKTTFSAEPRQRFMSSRRKLEIYLF